MTIPTRADFAKIDRYENSRRLARLSRRPWSVHKENKTMKQIITFALVGAAVFAFGCWYFGSWEWLGELA